MYIGSLNGRRTDSHHRDNEKNRELVRDVLQVKGCKTIESDPTEEGLNLATEKYPSLILMDIQLPVMVECSNISEPIQK